MRVQSPPTTGTTDRTNAPDAHVRRPSARRGMGSFLRPRNIGVVYVIILICVIFSFWAPNTFPRMATVQQILDSNAITALGALALVVPLATGTFDLSFAYTMSLSGVVAADLVANHHTGILPAAVLGIVAALVIGLINAFVVVIINIDSFIGTLATGSLVQAFITYFTNGISINNPVLAGKFSSMGSGVVLGVTYPVLYALVLAIALWTLMDHTPVGRKLYATGFNREAARLANIRVDRLRFGSLLVSAGVAGFAGVCLASSLSSGSPTAGDGYLLPGFAAAFVGATQFKDNRFNAWGTILAVIMLGTGVVGLTLAGAPVWAGDMFTGVVLLVALSASGLRGTAGSARGRALKSAWTRTFRRQASH